jgi:hypothetical protein
MGRTSKFLFPLPGRKTSKDKDQERERTDREYPSKTSSGVSISNKPSKAQRLLGPGNELNIDSPTRSEPPSWQYPSSRSSGMSISISESTHSTRSTTDTGSLSGSNVDRWDQESGVFPRWQANQLGKASSTILGQNYREDAGTDTSSRRMRHEASDSTLKSYYDRQKSPLAVSQQTSESSARDLALRKGLPPIVRSPLLQTESFDAFDQDFVGNNGDLARDASSKKKPPRLDLSMLLGRSRKSAAESLLSPASIMSNTTNASKNSSSFGRRKISRKNSKESVLSQKMSIRSTQSSDPRQRQPNQRQYNSHENDEGLRKRSLTMSRIPESRVPDQAPQARRDGSSRSDQQPIYPNAAPKLQRGERPRTSTSHLSPMESQGFSWKSVRSNMTGPYSDQASSAASISSRNTRTSRHTSTSVFSNSDLKQSSVLSLSSESEGDLTDEEPIPPSPAPPTHSKLARVPTVSSQRSTDSRHLSAPKPQASTSRKGSRKVAAQSSSFQPIPEASLPDPRISGPWLTPATSSDHERANYQKPEKIERKSSRKPPSLLSNRTVLQPTPPLSPTSLEVREVKSRSSRYMAVTKQEEQLLEALRQKRANMKKKIIEEHEIEKSPPRIPPRKSSRYSELSHNSSISTIRGPDGSSNKEHILLYLDTPVSDIPIDAPEPSPDLSDFLSFGSDGDSTPRTSWAPPQPKRDRLRPDSAAQKGDKISPMTPPSAARLSAVGTADFLRPDQQPRKRNGNVGVRFVEEEKEVVNSQDFLLEESDNDAIWEMQEKERYTQ